MITANKKNYFLSQPHQPYFTLGVVNAVIMMLLFALSYKGIMSLEIDTLTFHSYSLIYLVFTNFFTGFLFTTFPRFNQTQVIAKKRYINIFYANILASILFILGAFVSEIILIFAMFITLVSHYFIVRTLQNIYTIAQTADKSDSFWILNAVYFGLFGNVLFLLSQFFPLLLNAAINISFYLYLIFLAFSVAQRMIPFFSHSFAQKNSNFIKVVFLSFILESLFSSLHFTLGKIVVDLFLAGSILKELLRWDLHPLQSPPILWVLHLALFWLPTAFTFAAISEIAEIFLDTSFYYLDVHLLAIGFLSTVLIGFGTRVILGHAGLSPHADKFATKIFLTIQAVVLLRALYSINIALGWELNFLFDLSFTAWLVLFVIWGVRYGKILILGSKA
ncbi:NnrS family protein [Sulfurimonas sp.]|uniref:NnrS family protein n=1 Tax=Sulfurimonas sp. TaxID=2022749 RepID=UPI00263698C4|nr:NnrS family protein [Sulfurimonas sp.]